jgi:hypothetical protein
VIPTKLYYMLWRCHISLEIAGFFFFLKITYLAEINCGKN